MNNTAKKILIWCGFILLYMVYYALVYILILSHVTLGAIPHILIVGLPSYFLLFSLPRKLTRKYCRTEQEIKRDKSWEEGILSEEDIHYTYHDKKNDPNNKK